MRGWTRRYKIQTNEEAKRKKDENDRKSRRLTRRHQVRSRRELLENKDYSLWLQKKANRIEACDEYEDEYGDDVKCLCRTPFMTDEESEFVCSDDEKKKAHDEKKFKAAGFTQERIDRGETLLEVVKRSFRSPAVSQQTCRTEYSLTGHFPAGTRGIWSAR